MSKAQHFNRISLKQYLPLLAIWFSFASQLRAQDFNDSTYLITILQAGDCNNAALADMEIDSICNKYQVIHLYYLKGIKSHEVMTYAGRIFGRSFDTARLVSERQISLWHLNELKESNIVAFANARKIYRIKDIFAFEPSDLTSVRFSDPGTETVRLKTRPLSDSVDLGHTTRLRIDDEIRINTSCRFVKSDTNLFVLEPLFNNRLYRISGNSGKITGSIDLNNLVSNDTLLYYLYRDIVVKNPAYWDTLMKYSKELPANLSSDFVNIAEEDTFLYLAGSRQLLTFYAPTICTGKSFRIIYKFDRRLKLLNYYIDRYLSYGGGYPVIYHLDRFNSQHLQTVMVADYNAETKKIRSVYYKIDDINHRLKKSGKDTVNIPMNFMGKIFTNAVSHIANFGDSSNPAWLMDPYPYLFFPHDSTFHDLVNDKLLKDTIVHSNYLSHGWTMHTRLTGQLLSIFYYNHDQSFRIIYDLAKKKIIERVKIGDLLKRNLNVSTDTNGRFFYYPIEEDTDNYVFFE